MELLEILGLALASILVVIVILKVSDYKDEKPEDISFK
jgi:hypothetical protein